MSFSQFILCGVVHHLCILTNHYLNLAFQLFDREGLGLIDAQGINEALGENLAEEEMGQI